MLNANSQLEGNGALFKEEQQRRGGDRADAFERLAVLRMNRALEDIRLIGNLSSKVSYDYRAEDINAIVTTLRQAVDEIEQRFLRGEFMLPR